MSDIKEIDEITTLLKKCSKLFEGLLKEVLNFKVKDKIDSLIIDISSILNLIEPLSKQPNFSKNYAIELCKNMLYSLENLNILIDQNEVEEAQINLKCEAFSIFKMMKREINYFYYKVTDEKGIEAYFKEDEKSLRKLFITEKKDPERAFTYDISIIVLFYNNIEITKQCIDSITKYTSNVDYELITVNNGSDEETTKWAESLPHKKKINLKYNIGSSRGGTLGVLQNNIDGRFAVYISNDVIVTKNWLVSLLECIKSDPRIAFVSPVYNSASNRQAIAVSYTNMDEMQIFAEGYNKPNPKIWEERARLFGIAMMFRPWVFEAIGGLIDLYFSYDMFADDDLCVKLNRAGYKMVLCKDTFFHHYGSATLKDGQFEVMEKGRCQFYKKYGFDSWGALGDKVIFFTSMLDFIKNGPVNILAVNPQYGDEFLALKNTLKSRNITDVTVDVYNMDKRFHWGLEALADRIIYSKYMPKLETFIGDKQYNIIMLCQESAECNELENFLKIAVKHLDAQGKIFLLLDNIYARNVIYNVLMKRNLSDDYGQRNLGRKAFISLNSLTAFANSIGLNITDIIRVGTYCQKDEVIEQVIGKIIRLDNWENEVCYNTTYYNLGLGRK